jgi:hypothetical protein
MERMSTISNGLYDAHGASAGGAFCFLFLGLLGYSRPKTCLLDRNLLGRPRNWLQLPGTDCLPHYESGDSCDTSRR